MKPHVTACNRLERMAHVSQERNIGRLGKLAHQAKSQFGFVCASVAYDLALRLEQVTVRNRPPSARKHR